MARDLNQDIDIDDDKQMSRINSAGIINITLENLWRDVYNSMSSGDYSKWNIKLDAIWSLLGGDCEENGEEDKAYTKLNLDVYTKGSLKTKQGTGFKKVDNPNNSIQYLLLLKKNLFLRRLQNKQGKGTAYSRGDEDDID